MSLAFRGGIPYGLDFTKLSEAFPVPELTEGRVITHAELEAVINVKRTSSRYYGVINAWVAKQKSSNGIILVWQVSVGLKVLNPAEVMEFAETRTKQKVRQLGKAIRIFGWVDRKRLDSVGQKRLDHQLMVTAKLSQLAGESQKELATELAPIKSLPKRIT
jgi:hypothetical protein